MTWVNMLNWWQWTLLALLPPAIILLYFLKLKRQPLEVPSTYLWAKSIEDLHVNSIWQRLRRNLLLFLQLLIVGLVMLAMLRLGWRGSVLVGDRFIFLVDNSASMAASDVPPSRLAEARRRVEELIDQMKPGDQAMLISFSDVARVEQPFTDDPRDLRRRLAAIEQTERRTDLAEALRLTSGLIQSAAARSAGTGGGMPAPTRPGGEKPEALAATIYLLSDGKFPDVPDAALGQLSLVYVPIGSPKCANLAITAFNTKRPEGQPEKLQAFGRLENFGPADVSADVELLRDGSLADASHVSVKAGEAAGVAFDVGNMHAGTLELVVRPGGDLAADDRAWAAVLPPQKARVLLITPGDEALERGLASAGELAEIKTAPPALLKQPEYASEVAAGRYDLVIYELCRPEQMPPANTLFIGSLPPDGRWQSLPRASAPQVIDVDGAHPLMQLVDLGNVIFAGGTPLKPPAGATSLVDSNQGVLFAVAPREGWEDAVLGAEIVVPGEKGELERNTDWPLRLSFVVLLRNVVDYLGRHGTAAAAAGVLPGHLVTLHSDQPAEALRVTTPAGKTLEVRRSRQDDFPFTATEELGIYRVQEGTGDSRQFVVNLCDSAESDIRPRPENSIKIGFTEVAGRKGWEGATRETWKLLLLMALGVLLLEWYIYNRRIYI